MSIVWDIEFLWIRSLSTTIDFLFEIVSLGVIWTHQLSWRRIFFLLGSIINSRLEILDHFKWWKGSTIMLIASNFHLMFAVEICSTTNILIHMSHNSFNYLSKQICFLILFLSARIECSSQWAQGVCFVWETKQLNPESLIGYITSTL